MTYRSGGEGGILPQVHTENPRTMVSMEFPTQFHFSIFIEFSEASKFVEKV
jgi:hypothetical protein